MANTSGQHASSGPNAAGGKAESVKDEVVNRASKAVGDAKETARNTADNLANQARDVAGRVSDTVSHAVDDAQERFRSVSNQVAAYAEGQSVGDVGRDLVRLIERHPVPAVLIGVGAGFLIARALAPRS